MLNFLMIPFTRPSKATIHMTRMMGRNKLFVEIFRSFLAIQESAEDRINDMLDTIPWFPAVMKKNGRDYVLWHKALHLRLLNMLDGRV